VPHELSPANKAKRVDDAKLLLPEMQRDSARRFAYIMTGDERWFHYAYDSPAMFASERVEVVPRVSQTIASKKAMITIFFTGNRLARLVYLTQGQKYNKEYFINEILEGINRGLNGGAGTRTTKTLKIHMDNCQVRNALDTADKLRSMKLTRLPHPPYSPDFSPCDF
jgi:hypothetical protein